MTKVIRSLSEVSDAYAALFVDLWGCLHNGVHPYPGAVEALQSYRQNGGRVIFVTNSPRPWRGVVAQLDGMGVPRDCWDGIATSGDSARTAMFLGAVGEKVYHIGVPHDDPFFTPPEILEHPKAIQRVPLEEAEGIVCTGPFDPFADPNDMRGPLLLAKTKGLKFLCANPDIVVDRGDRREWCAGALAQLYTDMGGESLYFGKPHPPIYDLARRRLLQVQDIPDTDILAIGDGPATDVSGAIREGLDILFISGGLAAVDTGTPDLGDPDDTKLTAFLAQENISPNYIIGTLR